MAEGSVPCCDHTLENGGVLKTHAEVSGAHGQGVGNTLEATTTDTREPSDSTEPQPSVVGCKYGSMVGAGEARVPVLDEEEELVQSLLKVNASGDSGNTTSGEFTSAVATSVEESSTKGSVPHRSVTEGHEKAERVTEFSNGGDRPPQRSYSSRSFTFGKSQKKTHTHQLPRSKSPALPKYKSSFLRRRSKYVYRENVVTWVSPWQ